MFSIIYYRILINYLRNYMVYIVNYYNYIIYILYIIIIINLVSTIIYFVNNSTYLTLYDSSLRKESYRVCFQEIPYA